MPRITIKEVDKSWFYKEKDPNLLRVFVPGVATFGPKDPVELTDINALYTYFGTSPCDGDIKSNSWIKAASYLYSGIQVTFQRLVPANAKPASSISSEATTSSITVNYLNDQLYNSDHQLTITVDELTQVFPDDSAVIFDGEGSNPPLNMFSKFEDALKAQRSEDGTFMNFGLYVNNTINVTIEGVAYSFTIGNPYNVGSEEGAEAEAERIVNYINDNYIMISASHEEVSGNWQVIVTKNSEITITIGGDEVTFSIDTTATSTTSYDEYQTTNSYIPTEQYDEVRLAIDQDKNAGIGDIVPEGADYNSFDYTAVDSGKGKVGSTDRTNYAYFTAKYEGTYGNSLTLKVKGNPANITKGTRIFYVTVYDSSNAALETLTYDFKDRTSEDWYENTNDASKYIKAIVVGEGTNIWYPNCTDNGGIPVTFKLENGTDGPDDIDEFYKRILAKIKEENFDYISDIIQYDVDIITDGGFNNYDTEIEFHDDEEDPDKVTDVISAKVIDRIFTNLAKTRANSIYLIDGDPEWSAKDFFDYCESFSDTSYCAAFGPWSYATTAYDGVTRLLPGSYALLINWANSINDGNAKWISPAGITRSSLDSFIKRTKYVITKSDLAVWQSEDYVIDSEGYKVNPIISIRGNYCIYGNSTLLHSRADGSTSILQSFNVRVMTNMIKMRAIEIGTRMQFDQLADDLFNKFKTLMSTYLEQMKQQNGLFDYLVTTKNGGTLTLADRNTKTLPIKIAISPNGAVENFDITLEVNPSGVTFDE